MKSQKNFKTADVGMKQENRITNRQNADLLGNKLVKRSQPKLAKDCMDNEVDKRMFTNLEKELDDYVEKKSMKNHKGNSSAANRYKAADRPEPKMAKLKKISSEAFKRSQFRSPQLQENKDI